MQHHSARILTRTLIRLITHIWKHLHIVIYTLRRCLLWLLTLLCYCFLHPKLTRTSRRHTPRCLILNWNKIWHRVSRCWINPTRCSLTKICMTGCILRRNRCTWWRNLHVCARSLEVNHSFCWNYFLLHHVRGLLDDLRCSWVCTGCSRRLFKRRILMEVYASKSYNRLLLLLSCLLNL